MIHKILHLVRCQRIIDVYGQTLQCFGGYLVVITYLLTRKSEISIEYRVMAPFLWIELRSTMIGGTDIGCTNTAPKAK